MSKSRTETSMQSDQDKKKGKKFTKVNIEDVSQGKLLLPGRHPCDCMATKKHKLINNCLVCGRIVCEQEGEGPCHFCGNPVYLPNNPLNEQTFVMLGDSQAIMDSSKLKALEHKNKLLAYERNQVVGSNIIDDETDWYEISDNVWLTEKQRDFAIAKIKDEEQKMAEDQEGIKLVYDPSLGKFMEGKSNFDPNKGIKEAQDFMQDISQKKQRYATGVSFNLTKDQENIHQELSEEIRKKYQAQMSASKNNDTAQASSTQPKSKRVQHDEIFVEFKAAVEKKAIEEYDQDSNLFDEQIFPLESENGSCLSMHQPWASLVVYGFKRFEGRMWTSRYRGPLWIQAGSKVPTKEEIDFVEGQYKRLYKDVKDLPPFPDRYPTGSLLGIIDLEDIIRVEDYMRYIPEDKREETGCKYLFVCRNPRKLLYPIKLPGERQIFNIDDLDLRESAKGRLMKVRTNWYPYYANLLRDKERIPDEDLELDAMKLKYREEDIGLVVGDFFKTEETINFAEIFVRVLKAEGTKYIGKNYMKTGSLDTSNSIQYKLKKYVPLIAQKKFKREKQEFEEEMNFIDFFMISDKEKDIKVDPKYSLLIVLGRNVKFSYETFKKKTFTVNNGCIVLLYQDEAMKLTIDGLGKLDDTEEAKSVGKVTENNTVVAFIY